MKNKALRDWVKGERGRISELARHLGVSQPAVTKMIDGSVDIRFKYIKPIIQLTGLRAKDLIPEYYELFIDELKGIESITIDEVEKIKIDAIKSIKNIGKLEIESF